MAGDESWGNFAQLHPGVIFAITFGSTFVLLLCCMFPFRRRLLRFPKIMKKAWCGNNLKLTPYQVVREENKPADASQGADSKNGRLHIIWEVDQSRVNELLSPNPVAPAAGLASTAVTELALVQVDGPPPAPTPLPDGTSAATENGEVEVDMIAPTDEAIPSITDPVPAYQDGQLVEYYSKTNGAWVAARVQVQIQGTPMCPTAVYSVTVRTTGQLRYDVRLHMLRNSMKRGERVEAYSSKGHRWVPVQVMRQLKSKRMLSEYEIKTYGGPAPEATLSATASELRRSFESGASVEVYAGAKQGWLGAEVITESEYPGELTGLASFDPGSFESAMRPQKLLTKGSGSQVLHEVQEIPRMLGARTATGDPLECWIRVPVRMRQGEHKLVPSFLLRLQGASGERLQGSGTFHSDEEEVDEL